MNMFQTAVLFALPLFARQILPETATASDLERFLLPADEDGLRASMDVVFPMNHAGTLATAVTKYGPANARMAAQAVSGEAFRESYLEMADYLDRFGPCEKQSAGENHGWWSAYGEGPGEAICSELVKLIFATGLWNQVQYCRQLASGEVAPKTPAPEGRQPPYRLDEPPVATVWIKAEVLYGLADRALALRLQARLRESHQASPRVQHACLATAALLEKDPPNREAIGLALAQLLLRQYQALHLGHLEEKLKAQ